jgi:hypothetical protein
MKTEQASLQAARGLAMVIQETVNAEMNGSSIATLNDHGLPVNTPIEGSRQQHTSTDAAAEMRRKARGEPARCAQIDCMKLASRKGKMYKMCIAHGGGRRCEYENCERTCARTGTNPHFCLSHGGGKRCADAGCQKLAVSPTQFCKSHGGGKRCTYSVRLFFLLFLFVMSLSLFYLSNTACLHSLAPHDTSLTTIHPSINHQSTQYSRYLLQYRYMGRMHEARALAKGAVY